jgi:Sucrase/ferredoxin-like
VRSWRLNSNMVSSFFVFFFFTLTASHGTWHSLPKHYSHYGHHRPSAFSQTLQDEGWDVHTQLEDPIGSPLEDYPEGDEKEAEFSRRLQELDEGFPKRALILKTSHIGGHKYAGNVIVRCPSFCRVRWVLIDAARRTDLHAPGCWCMVRSCIDTRSRVYRAYDYPRGTNIASFIARRRQPRAARL